MDFQLLLIYSRVNCCTARGLAVGVGAEPRWPSGHTAGHIMWRLSWLLHLPEAGFKMHSHTCKVHAAVSQKEERKVGFRCSSACSLGTLVACRSWARAERSQSEERRVCLCGWVLPGAGARCFSYEDGAVPAHLFHLNCVSLQVQGYFVEGKENAVTQGYRVAMLQAASRAPKGLRGSLHWHTCLAVPSHRDKREGLAICSCVL